MDATYPNYKILVSKNNNSAVFNSRECRAKTIVYILLTPPMRPLKFVISNLCHKFGQDIEDLSKRLFPPFRLRIFGYHWKVRCNFAHHR
jgi:hypothetical protein